MFLYNLRRKLRRKRIDKQLKENGYNYHHHCWEIVVSENELLIQLQECDIHTNLLKLLIYGKSLPDYETRLMRAALKFEFLGSLVFPIDEKDTEKPPSKIYVRELFQGRYESLDEVKDEIQRIVDAPISDKFAKKIFRKLVFVINTCCPMMAETYEIWWECTYRLFIEYAIEHDDFGFADEDNIWETYPKDIPENGCIRSFLLKSLPDDFADKVTHGDSCHDTIRW